MDNTIFFRTLNSAAEEAGFYFTHRAFQDEFLRYSGEVAPALCLDIKKVRGLGHKFLCVFCIDVMTFEQEWTRYLSLNGFGHKSGDSMGPIGIHSLNYDLGMRPPYLRKNANGSEIDEMYRWMMLMFEHALKFPMSMEQLVDVLTQGRLLGSDVFRDLGHPVKVRAFFVWLRHKRVLDLVEKLSPIPESRVWPYVNINVDYWCV